MTEKNETKTQKRDIKPETISPQQPFQEQNEIPKPWEHILDTESSTQENKSWDSTSMVELTVMKDNFIPLITNEGKITDKMNKALTSIEKSPDIDPNADKDEQEKMAESELAKRVNIIREIYTDLSKTEKAITAVTAGLLVNLGEYLNGTKTFLDKHTSHNWERWADENLNIKRRTRQTYMKLAKIPNVENYLMLGKERLLHVDQVIKEIVEENDPDPIGTLLQKHDIDFEKATEIPLVEFKNMVDAAVIMEKASKKELNLDRDSVRGLIEMGFKFTNADFQQLVDIEDADGDPNKLLDKLLAEKGRRKEVYDQAKRKRESFIRASANIGSLVDEIIKEKKFDDIEVDKITKLIKKLKAFKKEVISQ